MMLVYVILSSRTLDLLSGHPERFGSILRALPYFVFSIHSWVYTLIDGNPVISAIGGGSPITWSISTEWFFYLAYPLIAWLILRARTPRLAIVLALLWCALWIAVTSGLYDRSAPIDAWAVQYFGPDAGSQEHSQESFVRWLFYFSPYVRMGEFMLGAFMAQLYINIENRPVSHRENLIGTVVFFAAAVSVIIITYLNYSPDVGTNIFRKMNMNFALAPTAALLVFCGARYKNAGSRMLISRPILLLGAASYSIYLVHDVVLGIAVKLTGSAKHGFAYDLMKLVLLLTAVLLISLVLYAYYEAPARKWLRGLWRKRPCTGGASGGLARFLKVRAAVSVRVESNSFEFGRRQVEPPTPGPHAFVHCSGPATAHLTRSYDAAHVRQQRCRLSGMSQPWGILDFQKTIGHAPQEISISGHF